MAVTRLADIVEPAVFLNYVQRRTLEHSALVQSGIIVREDVLDQLLMGGGRTFNIPSWDVLAQTEANTSSTDPAANSTPEKIGTTKPVAIRHNRNQSWSSMNLTRQLAGADPVQAIVNAVADYWIGQDQRMLLASLEGVIADNIANDSSDMVVEAYTAANAVAGAAAGTQLFTRLNFTSTIFTLGDRQADVTAIAVHSVIYKQMVDNDDISFIPDSEGKPVIPTFLGRLVLVDDQMPVDLTTPANPRYTSYLFGNGAFGWGENPPENPVETDRTPAAGNGGGQDTLYYRRQLLLHPAGFTYLEPNDVDGESPNNAALRLAANWNRVFDRKRIPLAALITG